MLSKDDPTIVNLLKQLQECISGDATHEKFFTVGRLHNALWNCGWNSKLTEDGKTVVLVAREESKQ